MDRDQVVIVPYRDGPYLVRGPLTLRDQEGREIEVTRRIVALCRCGKSRRRPFCDGTHRLVRFTAPSEPEDPFAEDRHDESGHQPTAQSALRRPGQDEVASVRKALELLLKGELPVAQALAIRATVPLLAGAQQAGSRAARLCLLHGAIDALMPATTSANSDISPLIARLCAIAAQSNGNGAGP